jgi:hypothetical protein
MSDHGRFAPFQGGRMVPRNASQVYPTWRLVAITFGYTLEPHFASLCS